MKKQEIINIEISNMLSIKEDKDKLSELLDSIKNKQNLNLSKYEDNERVIKD